MQNSLINLAKWPIAGALTVFAWFAAVQLPAQLMSLAQHASIWFPLICGTALYTFLWRYWLSRSRTAAWAAVLEHEVTHVLASLATFNGVHRLHADGAGTGHISVASAGNWIVSIAPYVFPTSLLIPALLIVSILPGWPGYCLFGLALGFHVQSTMAETHAEQTDLQKVGWPAVTLVLPACHVIIALVTVGFLLGHQTGMVHAWKQVLTTVKGVVSMQAQDTHK